MSHLRYGKVKNRKSYHIYYKLSLGLESLVCESIWNFMGEER